ncbi:MAG: DUF4238 domain-containing protein [Terracidiphilus sp.]
MDDDVSRVYENINMAKLILPGQKTAPERVRNEHIVPRFYLNKFADSEKHVVLYTKGRSPVRKSTKSQSSERDFFEYTINGQATENRYEKWFQRIETDAAATYDAIQSGSELTQFQQGAWAFFLATLFLRSRKVREQIGPELMRQVESEIFSGDDQIREAQCDLLKEGVFVYADDLKAMVSQIKHEMRAPAFGHLAGIEENARMLAEQIFEKRWFVFEAAPGTAFVTSDCPVHTMNVSLTDKRCTLGSGFGNSSTAVVLPLSPTRLFLAGPQEMSCRSNVLGEKNVVAFNSNTIRFAYRAVYSLDESAEIHALVDREINQVTYGQNAFVPLKVTNS